MIQAYVRVQNTGRNNAIREFYKTVELVLK